MAFKKDGEIKVFKKNGKVSPKLASEKDAERFTIDDLVERTNLNFDKSLRDLADALEEADEDDVSDQE